MHDSQPAVNTQQESVMAYVVVILAASFYFYEFFLRIVPTVITSDLMQSFSIGTGQLGQLLGCFFYAYALMQLPAGLLCDRYGARHCLIGAIFVCSLTSLVFQATGNFTVAVLSRLALGAASAFAFIGPLALSNRWFSADKQALITGCVQIMGCIGAVIAGSPIRTLVNSIGWRPAIYYAALVGLILCCFFFLILKNNPDDTPDHPQEHPSSDLLVTLKQVATTSANWHIGYAAFGSWAAVAIFAESWGVPFLNILQGQTDAESAQQLMWVWIAMAVFSPIAGWFSDYIQERVRPILFLLSLGLAASLALIVLQPQNPTFVSFLLFLIGTSSAAQPITFGLINDVNSKETIATAIALNNMILVCSTGILTPISGYILEYYASFPGTLPSHPNAFMMAFLIVPASILFCMVAFYRTIEETHCKHASSDATDSTSETTLNDEQTASTA